jgi:hypothetical protein
MLDGMPHRCAGCWAAWCGLGTRQATRLREDIDKVVMEAELERQRVAAAEAAAKAEAEAAGGKSSAIPPPPTHPPTPSPPSPPHVLHRASTSLSNALRAAH